MRPLLVLSLLVAALPASAQRPKTLPPVDSTAVIKFDMTKGPKRVGRVVAADDSSLSIVTLAAATVVLPRDSIEDWHRLLGTVTPAGWRPTDLATSHLFFGPTARRPLAQGCCSVVDIDVFIAAVGVRVHDRVMLSVGASLLESPDTPRDSAGGIHFADARLGLAGGRRAAVAVGAFWGAFTGPNGGSVGAGYGVVTLGGNDHAVTVLGGYPFATRSFAADPIVMLGGETRVGRRFKLLTEIWKLPQIRGVPIVYGVRWLGDEFAVEAGVGSAPWLAVKAGW